jgi:uncharacterized protein YceH (UPF0502 family)
MGRNAVPHPPLTRTFITKKWTYPHVGDDNMAATGGIAALKQRKKRKQKEAELEERIQKLEEEVEKLKQQLKRPT